MRLPVPTRAFLRAPACTSLPASLPVAGRLCKPCMIRQCLPLCDCVSSESLAARHSFRVLCEAVPVPVTIRVPASATASASGSASVSLALAVMTTRLYYCSSTSQSSGFKLRRYRTASGSLSDRCLRASEIRILRHCDTTRTRRTRITLGRGAQDYDRDLDLHQHMKQATFSYS